jgi:TetR/AcrR family transcriptional regulator
MVKPNSITNQSNSDSTEKRILAAARQEFIESGLRGARMQAIADRAGVNKSLVHYYFRSKQRLYDAVITDIVATITGTLRGVLSDGYTGKDFQSLLRMIITGYINTLRQNPDFPRFMIRELADGGSHLHGLFDAVLVSFGEIPALLNQKLRTAKRQGLVRPVKPVHLLLNILGMCVFTFIARPILSLIDERTHIGVTYDDAFFNDRIEAIFDLVCNGILKERHP